MQKHDTAVVPIDIPTVIAGLFDSVLPHKFKSPDCHAGEVSPSGISSIIAALPELQACDTFVDIGSGIGNVVAQVAIETCVGHCIGIELQSSLAKVSRTCIRNAVQQYPSFSKIDIFHDDIRSMSSRTYSDLRRSTVLYANNLVFDPTSTLALEKFATESPRLSHVIFTEKMCLRHRSECRRRFCSIWKPHQTISIDVSWSSKAQQAYLYSRNIH
eukprot:jgi/Phyca11/540458/estExt2_Genewise1Plus.C_PHYCAscaffold_50010